MWGWNKHRVKAEAADARFRQAETEVFRALAAHPQEIEAAANAPFLYRRLRASIEAEARRRAETGREWLTWLVTARQATPALALVALLAIGVFWTFTESYTNNQINELTASELTSGVSVSNDELLSALAGWEKHEPANGAENAGSSANSLKE